VKIKATIVMPETTPDIKVEAIKRFGGSNVTVVQSGTSFDQASECFDMPDNELAKLHVRHMVGGKPQGHINEHIFSFAFPEYPSALMHFLTKLGEQWNITLFHYRNHSTAEGLVLAGFDANNDKELYLIRTLMSSVLMCMSIEITPPISCSYQGRVKLP
jgi:hypothetical protein